MIQTDSSKSESVKDRQKREKQKEDAELKIKCTALANEKFGEDQVVKWSNANKGLWFLSITDDNGEIETMALMKPINRNILGYASTKMIEGGLYEFLEVGMRECLIASVEPGGAIKIKTDNDAECLIIDDDNYFLSASSAFNKIIEGKKASLLKR